MSENSTTELLALQEESEILGYLNIAFSNGFSKGTANVSPRDMKKLAPLLRHYGKKAHPFRACVKDNRKRFGSMTEKYCAVLKDLIKGTTKWRSTERKKNLSETELNEFILHWEDYPDNYMDEFLESLANLTDEDVKLLLSEDDNHYEGKNMLEELEMAAGEVAWTSDGSWNSLKRQVEAALNDHTQYGMDYWVEDMTANEALVCERGKDYYVVGYSFNKKDKDVTLDEETEWKPVERAWVESNGMAFSEENREYVAELYFTDTETKTDDDGLVWKTFLREGTWAYSPGNGQILKKPLTIKKSGKSDPKNRIISMAELKKNFEIGAIQHVTVPLSHDDKTDENTGFVKKLRYGKDEKGRTTLEAAIDFTEPDIKDKIDRGTIPNVSAGIHFNYLEKENGKKFDSVLGHLALTPKPWLAGMAPFGVKASENLNVVGFSEQPQPSETEEFEGGVEETMTTVIEETENTDSFLSEIGLSEDEAKAKFARLEELEKESRIARVDQKVRDWKEENKSPAVIKVAQAALLADPGTLTLNLSEDGKNEEINLTDLVAKLVEASPTVNLADDQITDETTEGAAPPDDATEENLSEWARSEANRLFLYERLSEKDAIAEALRREAAEAAATA